MLCPVCSLVHVNGSHFPACRRLIDLLSGSVDAGATQHAVCALRRCAASATAVTDLILASGGLPQLVILLEQSLHRAQYAVAQDLVWLIMSLGDDDDLGRAALRAAGALPVLVQMLSLHPLGPQVCPWKPSVVFLASAAVSVIQIRLALAWPPQSASCVSGKRGSPSLRTSGCGSSEMQCQGQKCFLPAHIKYCIRKPPGPDSVLITCCMLQGSARLKLPALAARALAVLMQNDAANQQQTAAAGAAPSLLRLLTQQEAAPQHATLLSGWLLGRRLLEQRVEAAAASRGRASRSAVADEDQEEDSLCLDVSFVNKRTQLRNLDATSREALWRVLSAGTSSLVTAKEAAGALRVLAAGEVSHHLLSNSCGFNASAAASLAFLARGTLHTKAFGGGFALHRSLWIWTIPYSVAACLKCCWVADDCCCTFSIWECPQYIQASHSPTRCTKVFILMQAARRLRRPAFWQALFHL